MSHTYAKKLFIVSPSFGFNWESRFDLLNLATLLGMNLPSYFKQPFLKNRKNIGNNGFQTLENRWCKTMVVERCGQMRRSLWSPQLVFWKRFPGSGTERRTSEPSSLLRWGGRGEFVGARLARIQRAEHQKRNCRGPPLILQPSIDECMCVKQTTQSWQGLGDGGGGES